MLQPSTQLAHKYTRAQHTHVQGLGLQQLLADPQRLVDVPAIQNGRPHGEDGGELWDAPLQYVIQQCQQMVSRRVCSNNGVQQLSVQV